MTAITDVALLKNLSSRTDRNFCDVMNSWNQLRQDVFNITGWDDLQRKELEIVMDNVNRKLNNALEELRDYLGDFNRKIDELQNGI